LAVIPTGLKVDPATSQTSQIPGQDVQATSTLNAQQVFAAGSAVKPIKQVVRAISEGQSVARSIHQFLSGQKVARAEKPFSSIMGRLEEGEIELFLNGPSASPRIEPARGSGAGFTANEACAEAQRCLHCDCRAAGNCKLQHYAELYGADAGRFRQQRRRFEQHLQHSTIIFEPGKCILCEICIQLAEQAREPLGLTFIDRGFDVRVSAPLNHTISEGLQKAAAECVEHCPTGALAFKKPDAAKSACSGCSAKC
jgi:ferredoxin